MTPRRRRMLEALPRRGRAPTTPPCSRDAVRPLAHAEHRPPDQRSDEERRAYVLSWRQEKPVAERPCRIHLSGIRFFDEPTRKRPWPVFALGRPRHIPTLPVVLRPRAVRDLLAVVQHPPAPMCLRLLSACGLRLREGPPRQVADLAPHRLLGPGRPGPGGQDRCVPRAPRVWEVLRGDWPRQRRRPWGFPARPRSGPLSPPSRHKPGTAVVRHRGLAQDASSHPLRHA